MNTPARTFLLAALVSFATWTAAAVAQDTSAPVPAAAPAASQPAATPSEPSKQPDVAPAAEPSAPSELPRLDEPTPAAPETTDVPAAASSEPAASTEAVAPEAPEAPESPAASEQPKKESRPRRHSHRGGGNERVSIWDDSRLEADQSAQAVVSVFGSSTSAGEVHDAVVSVFGSSQVTGGSVGNAVVSVLGTSRVNAIVHGEVVAVMGNIELGPEAEVYGQLVCVGGKVIRDPAAKVHGQVNQISFGFNFGGFEWLHAWITQCLLYARPLAFSMSVMWAWWIALGFFALYLVLALLFPAALTKTAETLEQRPGYSILTAFLVTLLAPAAVILLAVTVVGAPALALALFVAELFGKAAMMAWIGRRITKLFGDGPLSHPIFAVFIGGAILLLLYTVPVVGFVVIKLTSWLGLGVVVYALILEMQRNKAAVRPVVASGVVPPGSMPAAGGVSGFAQPGVPTNVAVPVAAAAGSVTPPMMLVSAATQPRAGFWIRLAASLIDAAIVCVVVNLFPDEWEPNFLLMFAAYFIVLWGTKGTTIGGIVCSLKVVRLDDRPVDWPTALVRSLASFISLVPAGLGFIWVAFDDQRQSWHDKIAGTTVVRVPRGISLI
jgi:uncharacterized RDD family membrane protein YckC